MTALISVGVIAAIVAGVFWARAIAARGDRRSIDNYQRARGVIGAVARRSESSAPVAKPTAGEVARTHVRLEEDGEFARVERPMLRPPVPPSIVVEPREAEHAAAIPVFGDSDPSPVVRPPANFDNTRHRHHRRPTAAPQPRPASASSRPTSASSTSRQVDEDEAPHSSGPQDGDAAGVLAVDAPGEADHQLAGHLVRPHVPERSANRRAAMVGAAVIVVGAASVGAWQLTSGGNGQHAKTALAPPSAGRAKPTPTVPSTSVPSTPVPSTLQPTLVSADVVTFKAPARAYTLSFTASGTCWVGVERSVKGPYLWMTTINPSGSASFRATGAVTVRIGAPSTAHLALNGIAVALPPNRPNPYDVAFTLSGPPSH